MFYYYFFLKEREGTNRKIHKTDWFLGDIGEEVYIIADDCWYIIEDYAEEFIDLEEPEDY